MQLPDTGQIQEDRNIHRSHCSRTNLMHEQTLTLQQTVQGNGRHRIIRYGGD